MSELFSKDLNKKKEALKELIKRIHEGENPDELKRRFRENFGDVTSEEIARVEEELIKEGFPREEIIRLCEVHLAVFRESVQREQATAAKTSPFHPINILMKEHDIMLENAKRMVSLLKAHTSESLLQDEKAFSTLEMLIHHFKEAEKHYLREENALFPLLEKYGVTEPPKIMWMEHDSIREIKKSLFSIFDSYKNLPNANDFNEMTTYAEKLFTTINSHFFKENSVLFPTALRVAKNEEWEKVKQDFDEIGYCCFYPQPQLLKEKKEEAVISEESIKLPSGSFTLKELIAVLNTLPVDITFVDKNDEVKFFNETKDRIFVRTRGVIGRKVQNCHPQKSVHIVEKILKEFKEGRRDVADFWIWVKDRYILIRYFAVRDENGEYLGTLEVSQDITDIKKLEGEKRLLDWE
uniref:DUF438 domain-containing protein n=1 Tax=candidate division WOR-3 bacterium TaxID=2052148 RepID=A0A7C2K452_UNCW3